MPTRSPSAERDPQVQPFQHRGMTILPPVVLPSKARMKLLNKAVQAAVADAKAAAE